jgi:RNA polymerase primary sigma factor
MPNPTYEYRDKDLDYLSSPRHRRVIYMRYGLLMTLEQVGRKFGVTRERIRQIEQQGLRQIADARSKDV